jgi:DNA primase
VKAKLSDRYTIEYEVGDLLFEFTPATGFKGDLTAVAGEQPLTLKIDLNSAEGRSKFMKEAYDLYPEAFTLEEIDFRRALNDLATHVDEEFKIRAARAELEEDEDDDVVVEAPEPGTDEYDAAMALLRRGDVLEEVAETMRRLGHVGEWENKKLAFLCAISARAQLPVQPSTHAQSSAGKNYLWDNVLALVPPELVHKRTGFSAKALFRTQMSLKHSVLYIQELAGSEGADFSIRTLQSDNVLKWEATEKQPDGTMANVEYEVEGPTVIVQTTTRNHLHPENETRVVPIYLDESSEQTDKIVGSHLRRASGKKTLSSAEEEALRETWQDAIRLLEPAEVIIPFAERIKVPSQPLRMRRDVPRLISLIRLVAWLHQETRGRDGQDRILATEDDFEKAIEIVGDSFARAWKSLTPTEEKVYEAITTHVAENLRKHGFKRLV